MEERGLFNINFPWRVFGLENRSICLGLMMMLKHVFSTVVVIGALLFGASSVFAQGGTGGPGGAGNSTTISISSVTLTPSSLANREFQVDISASVTVTVPEGEELDSFSVVFDYKFFKKDGNGNFQPFGPDVSVSFSQVDESKAYGHEVHRSTRPIRRLQANIKSKSPLPPTV